MDGIVTLLAREQDDLVHGIWRELQETCGMRGIEVTPIPHFSWSVAEQFDLNAAEILLQEISAAASSFSVTASGLGIFVRADPVVFIPVVKNRALLELHEVLWDRLKPLGTKVNQYYAPEVWIPHVTLAHRDLPPEALHCAVSRLMRHDLYLEISVDNLAIVCQEGGQIGELRSRYPFGAG